MIYAPLRSSREGDPLLETGAYLRAFLRHEAGGSAPGGRGRPAAPSRLPRRRARGETGRAVENLSPRARGVSPRGTSGRHGIQPPNNPLIVIFTQPDAFALQPKHPTHTYRARVSPPPPTFVWGPGGEPLSLPDSGNLQHQQRLSSRERAAPRGSAGLPRSRLPARGTEPGTAGALLTPLRKFSSSTPVAKNQGVRGTRTRKKERRQPG